MSAWIVTGRRCPYSCSICGGSRIAQQYVCGREEPIYREPTNIFNDIVNLYSQGVRRFYITHDFNIYNTNWRNKLFNLLKKESMDIGVYYECWQLPFRRFVDCLFKIFTPQLSDIVISPETGDENVRAFNFPEKSFTNKALISLLSYLQKYEVDLHIYFSSPLPLENKTTYQKTLQLSKDIVKAASKNLASFTWNILTIDPYSLLWLYPEKYKINKYFTSFMDYYKMCENGKRVPGYSLKTLPERIIYENIKNWREIIQKISECGPSISF